MERGWIVLAGSIMVSSWERAPGRGPPLFPPSQFSRRRTTREVTLA